MSIENINLMSTMKHGIITPKPGKKKKSLTLLSDLRRCKLLDIMSKCSLTAERLVLA